ncbi:MAG: Protein-export rane protein SecF [Patescibacteria group bacterium]|nr:Protein-export rane protein SecF [Patescibacteria group bacterium]
MKSLNVIAYAKLWVGFSALLIVASLVTLVILKPNFGIDFTGGSLMEITVKDSSNQALHAELLGLGKEAVVQSSGEDSYFVRLGVITESEHQEILSGLRITHPDVIESKFDSVGPVIGDQLKKDAAVAVVVLLVLIALYIAWAFRRVSEPVPSWKYGIATLFAAFHDVIIPLGVFAILGRTLGYQIDIAFVAAMLTILGYSINDTIVVFDRTRENLGRYRHSSKSFGEIVNQSIVETLGRSLNTTLTTLLPLIAIFAVGGETTRPFVLALIVGIVAGAYSSIFFASPMLVLWDSWSHRIK